MDFWKHYFNEDEKLINLDDEPSGKKLGDINTDDDHYDKIINRIKTQLNISEVDKALDILLKDKHLDKYRQEIRRIFGRYTLNADQLEKFANDVRGKNSFYYNKPIFTIQEMYQHYNNFAKNSVHPKFYEVLFDYVPGGGASGQIGRGEIYLALLTHLDFPSSKKGDLVGPDGSIIEVKFDGGRFKGPDTVDLVSGPEAIKNMEKMLGEKITSKTVNNEVMSRVFDFLKKNPKKIKDVLKIFMNYRTVELPPEALNMPLNSIEDFKTLVLTLHAYGYIKVENIDKLIFISRNHTFKTFDFKSFQNLYKFIKENLENLAGWASSKWAFKFVMK